MVVVIGEPLGRVKVYVSQTVQGCGAGVMVVVIGEPLGRVKVYVEQAEHCVGAGELRMTTVLMIVWAGGQVPVAGP